MTFVFDAFARRIVGWKVSTAATAGFVLDALEQAIHALRPGPEDGLIHHSDGGVQYLAMSYTQRLSEAEVFWQRSWLSALAVEMATLRWTNWSNNHRLFGCIGHIPPAEAEANYYAAIDNLDMVP